MSLDYEVLTDSPLTPAAAVAAVSGRLGLPAPDGSLVSTTGLSVSVRAADEEDDLIEDAYGFRPTLSLFVSTSARDTELTARAVAHATMTVLEGARNGVLLFNGERTLLRLTDGRLVLDADWGDWRLPGGAGAVTLPHEFGPLASPLL